MVQAIAAIVDIFPTGEDDLDGHVGEPLQRLTHENAGLLLLLPLLHFVSQPFSRIRDRIV
jgi:hypothetical protein